MLLIQMVSTHAIQRFTLSESITEIIEEKERHKDNAKAKTDRNANGKTTLAA